MKKKLPVQGRKFSILKNKAFGLYINDGLQRGLSPDLTTTGDCVETMKQHLIRRRKWSK
jgi:hypothetical protein